MMNKKKSFPETREDSGQLITAIRLMIAAECETIKLYISLASKTEKKWPSSVHAESLNRNQRYKGGGAFLKSRGDLTPNERKLYDGMAKQTIGEAQELQTLNN